MSAVFPNPRARAALFNMRRMEANWDSYGAKPIDENCIQKALNMLEILHGEWFAVPVNDGSVQLEQHCNGFDLELLISTAPTSDKAHENT